MEYLLLWVGFTLLSYLSYKNYKRIQIKRIRNERYWQRKLEEPYLKRFETKRNEVNTPKFEYKAR